MGLTRPRAAQIYDIDYKQAVRVITTSNITLSGGAPAVVDGVTLSLNDRILVAGQSTASQNGIYRVSVTGTGSNGTWVRTTDNDATGELLSGTIVMVSEGATYADTSWKLTTNNPITIGTTALTFEINTGNAFGTISANGTSVIANSATGTVTFSTGNNIVITGNATTDTITFAVKDSPTFYGNVLPGANVTYDLGSTTSRWRDIWLANSTIYLGNAQISANATSVIITNPAGGTTVLSGATPSVNANTVVATGNIAGGNLITTGVLSVTGNANVGNLGTTNAVLAGSLTGATTISASGNANVGNIGATNANLTAITATGNANVGNLGTAGLIVATGNITGGNLITAGLGSIGTTLSVTGNANVGNLGTAGQITATGNVTANNVNLSGNIVDTGALSLITGASGNISLAPSGTNVVVATTTGANITGTLNATGNANVGNLGTAGLITATGNVSGGNLTTSGQVTASGNITGNYLLANITFASGYNTTKLFNGTSEANIGTSGGNANITIGGVSNVAVFSTAGANISGTLGVTGNITGGNLSGTLITGTLTTAAQPNVTSVGTLTSLSVTGNVTGGNLSTTGTGTIGTLSVTGNALIAGNLVVDGTTTNINITDLNVEDPIIGLGRGPNNAPLTVNDGKDRGEQLWYYDTAERSAFIGYDNSAGKLIAATNVSVSSEVVTVNNYGNLVVGGLESTTISSSGNANVGNLGTAGQITATGNLSGANLNLTGNIVDTNALSLVTGSSGNISLAPNGTNVVVATTTGANITGTLNATGNANVGNLGATNANVTAITATGNANVGNLGTTGQITATGNITGGNLTTAGNITGNYLLANITFASGYNTTRLFNGTSEANIGVSGGNLAVTIGGTSNVMVVSSSGAAVTGTLTASGNANVGNLGTAGQITATGNITSGNLNISGNIVDTGALSLITGASGNVALAPNGTNVVIATTTGANITGTLNATGNANVGNLGTTGQITATGNITGGNILGNGYNLTGINTFSSIAVSGANTVVADSIADTLTLAAGAGITIVTNSATDTITIAAASSGSEIFVDGADFGTITEAVTLSQDLGLITAAVEAQSDLGEIVISGVFYPTQLVLPTYTVSTLPSATIPAQIIYVSNATGGAITAFSDGTNWRRTSDRSIIN